MYQKPEFRRETRVRISWPEVECNLPHYVVEVPWKSELDPVSAHRCDISSLSADRSAARLGRLGLWLGNRFRICSPAFAAGFGALGVARAGVFCAGFAFGSGISLSVDCAALGCVTGVVAWAWPLFTSPMALSPGGAATILTRYMGGSATGLRSLSVLKRSVATAA